MLEPLPGSSQELKALDGLGSLLRGPCLCSLAVNRRTDLLQKVLCNEMLLVLRKLTVAAKFLFRVASSDLVCKIVQWIKPVLEIYLHLIVGHAFHAF